MLLVEREQNRIENIFNPILFSSSDKEEDHLPQSVATSNGIDLVDRALYAVAGGLESFFVSRATS